MTLKTQWLLLALFSSLPYLVLGAAGALWLYEAGWGLWWLAGAALVSLIGWPLLRWLQKRTPLPAVSLARPAEDWSPAGTAAWAGVEEIARRVATADLPLDQPEPILDVAREVIETVARHFHPRSRRPVLEIPIPHLLRIAELVARDLREECSANIPGSHILTVNDLLKLKKLAQMAPNLFRLYRVARLVVDPAGALLREMNALAQDRMLTASFDETRRWVWQFAVKRIGYYAIELYSGHLALRGVEFAGYTTGRSERTVAQSDARDTKLAEEPLRILVLGQVKAGKSSLVNALFGETKAAVDVVPRTRNVDAYLLEREGLKRAIILDTAGYEDATLTEASLEQARDEIERSDLVILVTAAHMPARDADRRLVEQVRALIQRDPNREFPPLVVAVTHIDQLRPFREWNPPYDLAHAATPKAQSIRAAVEAAAADLRVDIERVVPVCLHEKARYNVDEGLIPVILNSLGAAQRLKYLRCLREFKDEQYWGRLRQQAVSLGRILVSTGWQWLDGSHAETKSPEQQPAP
ncbi:MAG: GTPase family protein [Planctomycetaceae bacterium]